MFGGGGFGNRTTTGFGQTSTFGKPSTSFATQGFGTGNTSLFGQPTQPTTSLFGSTATAPTFGQQTTTSQSFGSFGQGTSTSIFGNQQSAAGTTGTIFGSPAATTNPAGTGLFSGGSTSFGGNSAFGTFASTPNSGSMFGQPQQQQAQSASIFGQPSSTGSSLFTSTASAFGGGSATTGTPIKFNPVTGTDTLMKNGTATTIQIKHHCITCMREYENKSLEELRFEDYAANRKGPSQGTQTGTGLFGNPAQPSLFGSNPSTSSATGGNVFGSNAFGQAGAFGQPSMQGNNSLFSKSSTTTAFGQPTTTQSGSFSGFNQSTNLFGGPANQAKPAFGGAQQQAGNSLFSGGNMGANNSFGQQQGTGFSGFGTQQQQTQPGIGLFNSPQQNKFGTGFAAPTQTTSSFTFGTNTNPVAGNSLFAPKPAGTGFGVTSSTPSSFTANPFAGNTTTAGTGLFGNGFNKQQPSGFGLGQTANNTSTFGGANLTNNSLFNNTAARPGGGLFSNTGASSSGLFGGGAFGTNTGLGGSTTTGFGMTSGFGTGTADPLQNCTGQPTLTDIAQLLNAFPYGLSPHHRNLRVCTGKTDELLKPLVMVQKPDDGTNNFKVSTGRSNIVTRRAYASIDPAKKSLFDKIDEEDILERNILKHRQNPRYFKLKPKSLINRDRAAMGAEKASDATFNVEDTNKENRRSSPSTSTEQSQTFNRTAFSPDSRNDSTFAVNTMTELTSPKRSSTSNKTSPFRSDDSVNRSREPNSSLTNDSVEQDEESEHFIEDDKPHACKIKLLRSDYFTIPTLDDLDEMMDEDGRCIVKNFTIGRRNYGNVVFYDPFDVAGLDLDSIVHFRHKEVEIYPNDAEKPAVGEGLNREAQVTLDRVWPVDKVSRDMIKDPTRLKQMNFEERLKRASAKMNARFVEYRPLPAGSWVFEVEHFSKYGLDESDDEGGSKMVGKAVDKTPSKQPEKSIPHYLKNIFAAKGFETARKRGLDGKFLDDPDSEPMNCDFSFMDENDEVMKDAQPLRTFSSQDSIREPADFPSPTEKLLRKHDSTLHKVQLMKASFYVQDDSPDAEILLEKGTPDLDLLATGRVDAYRSTDSPNKNILPLLKPHFLSKFPTSIDVPLLDFPDEEYKQPGFSPEVKTITLKARALSRPQRVATKYRGCAFATEQSVIRDVQNALCDTGLYFGRHFRVGWSTGLSFVCLTAASEVETFGEVRYDRSGKLLAGRAANDTSRDVVTRLQMSTEVSPELLKHVESHLDICLKATDFRVEDGVPFLRPQLGASTLHEHCDFEQKTVRLEENFDRQVWELMVALWGEVPGLQGEHRNHKTRMVRKSALSTWLKNVIRATPESETDEMSSSSRVLMLLTRGDIHEACQAAVNNGDVNLALLISQIGTNEVVRSLMEQQLKQWHESEADQAVDTARLKIITLIAGHMLYASSKGFVNTCENLDWKKVFALHLWYITRPSDSLIEALNQYEQAYKLEEDKYAAPPTPSYVKSDVQFETADGRSIYDLHYHLMKLYARRSYPLEKVLNPISYTCNVLDYRLSWLMMTTLKSLQYNHLSKESEHSIHTSFAAQLEIYGLWHWAVFVLLHIQDLTSRVDYVQNTIDKHVELLPRGKIGLTDKERFVHEDLKVPLEWIFYSKAVLAASSNKMVEAAWYYVKAQRWNEAHKIIMNHLLVKAIVNEKREMVQNMLGEIAASGCIVEGWNHGGAVVYDYLTIVGKVDVAIAQSVDNVSFLDALEPLVSSVCSRIKNFPTSSPKERICQAEISKRMIQLIQIISQLRSGKQGLSINFGVNLIDQLPLPADYEKQELQEIISRWIDK